MLRACPRSARRRKACRHRRLGIAGRAGGARADDAPPVADDEVEAAAAAAVAFPDHQKKGRYVIDDTGAGAMGETQKRSSSPRALRFAGAGRRGRCILPRVEAVRYRLLALGYFVDVRLS